MPFTPVAPDQTAEVALMAEIINTARAVDDPTEPAVHPEELALGLRYGWDLEPAQQSLYTPDGADSPVAVLGVNAPKRDNLKLITGDLTVHPQHRRQGHGSALLAELLRQAGELNRSIVWLWSCDDDRAAEGFVTKHGFTKSSREARRLQVLAHVDHAAVDQIWLAAVAKSQSYQLERRSGVSTPDDVLSELIEVTASINDAPMGDLTFEPSKFNLQRLKDFETATGGRRQRLYRVIARHRETGVVGGHTMMAASDFQPERAMQLDTAVHRDHRGHRLGALLKIDMMRWLAETEPQATEVVTFNNADNSYMISINEQIGYRLTGLFADWERTLA